MDNFRIDVTGEGAEQLRTAFRLLEGRRVNALRVVADGDRRRLVLHWMLPRPAVDGAVPMPFPMSMEQAAEFVAWWLDSLTNPQYGERPSLDGDGDSRRGWRLHNDVEDHTAFACVEPTWALYGR